ncbi:hypothetical protein [Vaginisenegalia massiliensis]|uniref:hypothetical protein n=1 Tax=Vaginisenegalia massiliensis TaxID=2058294 RepID=UPI000F525950|nr:hypothetical protein [Vaginisenegalia massiliensis]
MKNKSIFIGYYNNLEIYYDRKSKTIETSGIKKQSFNQSKLVGLMLVTYPLIKIINSMMTMSGVEARIIVWIASTMLGVFLGYLLTSKIYSNIKLTPMSMDKEQFEDVYLANEKSLQVVKWVIICSILALFIEVYVYLISGIFIAVFTYLLNIFIVTLLFLGGVHSRQRIFEEIKNSYSSME